MNQKRFEALRPAVSLIENLLPRGGRAEVMVATIVVAIVIAMILPVPEWLLDCLIALNICTASLLVVLAMQIKESVNLSAFPSLLLITTLFRVSLNVASTRLILLEGSAGHIIEAFGKVVVGGNLVVGMVVFFILTVIQFLVITKGSERVAEVGARFALDAMPGKQMAIDMELKASSITADEARIRRAVLGQESQFFGAMDGAMKFVKGDAIAGIIIVLTNLVGGLAIGVLQRQMSGSEAVRVYSVLSIGDALVAQIPALLMSLTAGLLITRVANAQEGPRNVGKELTSQLTAYPKAWVIASGVMLVFGLIPGMPTAAFIVIGGGSLAFGINAIRRQIKDSSLAEAMQLTQVAEIRDFDVVRPFLVRVASHVTDGQHASRVINLARSVRNDLVKQYGLVTPAISVEFSVPMSDADFDFCHNEVRVFAMDFQESQCTLQCDPQQLELLGLAPSSVETSARLGKYRRVWLPSSERARLAAEGLEVEDFWEHVEFKFRAALHNAGPRFFNIEQTQKLYRWLASKSPDLAKELERSVPAGRAADVLQRLLGERVSIRNIDVIFETLVEWGQRERDPGILCECVRSVLSREIFAAQAIDRQLHAFVVEPELETLVRGAVRQTNYGDFLALDNATLDPLLDGFAVQLEPIPRSQRPVILCEQDIRPHLRRLFATRFDDVPVLSLSEVPSDYKANVLGVIRQGHEI
jgi:type III secretion protein V